MNTNEEKNENVAETTPSTETAKTESTPNAKSSVAKKVTAKKVEAKKTPAKKATVKPAAKTPAKKAPVKPAAKTPAKKAVKAPVKKTPAKKGKAEKRTADNSNRNFGRIKVGGETLSKGRAVLAVIASFVEKKKATLAQLNAAFDNGLMKNYGLVQEIGKARKFSMNGKDRFFVKKEDLITTRDGKTIAVCNQVSDANIKPIIKCAKALGFIMTPVAGK